jgi:hypothetical protein
MNTPAKKFPRMQFMEVLTVGLPFCVFKIATGLLFYRAGGSVGIIGALLVVLGVIDSFLNAANLAALALVRRRIFDACMLSFMMRLARKSAHKPRWTLQDFGNSLDVLLSFTLVAYMVGRSKLAGLPSLELTLWNLAVVLNVLGAGLGRFTDSFQNLTEHHAG